MKYTIHGYSQREAVSLKLGSDDLLLLRWLSDFSHTKKMEYKIVRNVIYYWVNYKTVCDDLPIISPNKRVIARRLKNLCDAKVLKHHTVKVDGTYSYYAFSEAYDNLLIDDEEKETCKTLPLQDLDEGYTKNGIGGIPKMVEGVYQKRYNKDLSTKYNQSTKETTTEIPEISSTETEVKKVVVVSPSATVSPDRVKELQKEIKGIINASISVRAIESMIAKKGEDQIYLYLQNWDKFQYQTIKNVSRFFETAVCNGYDIPTTSKGKNKVAQETNYKQRSSDDFAEFARDAELAAYK